MDHISFLRGPGLGNLLSLGRPFPEKQGHKFVCEVRVDDNEVIKKLALHLCEALSGLRRQHCVYFYLLLVSTSAPRTCACVR